MLTGLLAWIRRSPHALWRLLSASWLFLAHRIDWILMFALVVVGLGFVRYRPDWLQPAPAGSLAGALFSGAAVLLANAINRRNQQRLEKLEHERRRAKLLWLVTAELRAIAYALIDAKLTLDDHLERRKTNFGLVPPDVRRNRPRKLGVSGDLAADLLLLDELTIDVLVRLESRLEEIRTMMDQVSTMEPSSPTWGLWGERAEQLSKEIANCMRFVLATAFDRIAPATNLQLAGREPVPAAVLLTELGNK
jgi:hypothetical protein